MKIGRILILGIAAFAGYIYYNRFQAVSNVASGMGSDSSYSSQSSMSSHTGIGGVGGLGGVGKAGSAYSSGGSSKNGGLSLAGIELLRAAAKGDLAEVEDLIGSKTPVDIRDKDRRTPLMYAAWNGHNEICAKLLATGANIKFKDRAGYDALDYAAGRGLTETVQFLLSLTNTKDAMHYVAFAQTMKAAQYSRIDMLPEGTSPKQYINRITPEGQSPLHLSTNNGYVPMAEALIKLGAQVNLLNDQRQTPLHWAAWNNHTDMIKFLLANGAATSTTDSAGNTPMLMAVQNNSVDAVKLLLASGAQKNPANKQGQTALMIATDKGFKELAQLLR